MSALAAVFARELRAAWSGGSGAVLPFGFFAGGALLVPFAIGADPELLARLGPGFVWVMLALSAIITLERMIQSDLEDGVLDQLVISRLPLELIALSKVTAHWLVSGLSLLLAFPMVALMLAIPVESWALQMAAIAIGSPAFFLWGGMGAALAAGVRRGGPLISAIVLPLYSPIIIFGAGVAYAATGTGDAIAPLLLLGANSLAALALSPFATAAAMRLGTE